MRTRIYSILFLLTIFLLTTACDENNEQGLVNVPFEKSENGSLDKGKREKIDFPGVPFWARSSILQHEMNGYACIYFYVKDPYVIPKDFNLISFWDERTFLINPEWAVKGYHIMEEGEITPVKTRYTENGKMHFWFLPADVGAEVFNRGFLTMPQLEELNPIKGFATDFRETIHLMPSYPVNILKANAVGYLENGKRFKMNYVWHLDFVNVNKFTGNLKFE